MTSRTLSATGLDLLAAAATARSTLPVAGTAQRTAGSAPLLVQTPFNPAACLSQKAVKKVLDLNFVEMAELSNLDDEIQSNSSRPPAQRPPVTDVSLWIERYSLMMAILATCFPHKAPELFAYQATVVRAERNYKGKRWVTYDRQNCREALACRSVTDSRLYNEAFTGRAKAITRCSVCLADDHTASLCPRNTNRPLFGWQPETHYWPPPRLQGPPTSRPLAYQGLTSQEACRRFNGGRCNRQRCKYSHYCSGCGEGGGAHASIRCPAKGTAGHSRSPTGPLPAANRQF